MNIILPYGYKNIEVNIPDSCKITMLEPKKRPDFLPDFLKGVENEEEIVDAALENPIGLEKLESILNSQSTVAIVVDDITRPTPAKIILKPILKKLHDIGIEDNKIDIIFAYGSHRVHTKEEKEILLGSQILSKYRVHDHNAHEVSMLKEYGTTSRGTPVLINKIAALADLRILTGIIKPHCQAAYSGGGKSILPGIASIGTIIYDHNFDSVSKGLIGVVEGNPMRNDIEEAADKLGVSFILNVVLDSDKKIVAAVAGDMIKAHRVGCNILDSLCRFTVNKQMDIGIVSCGAPFDINLYQAINGIVSLIKIKTPVIKKNATIILAAECSEGLGHSIFKKWRRMEPQDILDKIKNNATFEEGIWAIQVLSECRRYANIIVVSEEKNKEDIESTGLTYSRTMEEALNVSLSKLRDSGIDKPEILVLPDAPYMIMDLNDNKGL